MDDIPRPGDRPGLRLTYPVEVNGEVLSREIPLVVGVLGDFARTPVADRPPLRDRRFVRLTAENLRQLAASRGPEDSVQRLLRLVELAAGDPSIRIRALEVTKAELAADFHRSPSLDQSVLWKMIYESEYGTFGGEPYGMILADFSFACSTADVAMLENFARIGADASCSFIAAASPRMFGLERWEAFAGPERLDSLFASKPYADWHALRNRDEARFVVLTAFGDALDTGAELVQAFARTEQWTDAGGPAGEASPAGSEKPLEIALAHHGFLVGHGALRGARTVQRPKRYHQPEPTARAEMMTRLPHVLTSSQFLRAVTCLSRDKVGSFSTLADVESFLNRWIQNYVEGGGPTEGEGARALRPLSEARLRLRDIPGAPGQIEVILDLRINLPGVQFARTTRHAMRTFSVVM